MDYHSLKRRELQALCKEHNIPANSANSVLADKLSALLNEKKIPKTRKQNCMKSSVETTDESEPAALKRLAKKVRFSPNIDLVEYEYELRSGKKQKDMVTQMKTRRKSMVNKPVVDNNITVESVEDTAQIPVRATRSRVQLPGKDVVILNIEKKQSTGKTKGRREAKDAEKGTDVDKITEVNAGKITRSKAHTLEKGGGVQSKESKQSKRLVKEEEATETVKEAVVGRVRVTRSKSQTFTEGGTGHDANPHVKKKTGKQVKTDEQSVEPFKEIMDVPVRTTRSTRQSQTEDIGSTVTNPQVRSTRSSRQSLKEDIGNAVTNLQVRTTRSTRQSLKEDIGNTVTNNQADRKRTRREMKATDLSSNLSHVAPVDKQEPPKRKSLRTRGAETVDEGEGDKMEVVNDSRVTRSKVPLPMEASGRNSRNKANKVEIQQLEAPVKHAGKKSVNRRKSVLQPEKIEVDTHLEEPVKHPARKNTRRKSFLQNATKAVESPTVEKKQSKGLSGNIDDKENAARSGKDASENDFEEVSTQTPKSRKRRGTPIIEDHIIEPEYDSLVDKSPKISTRSASKSEGKSFANKLVESSLKKPMSRMNNKSPAEKASLEGRSSAIRSGAVIRDSTSKKRAKLSGTKQSDSEDHAVSFSKEGTPIAKMREFKLDKEVTEPEVTPAFDKSDRRFTRSAIKSERKEPSQSANKEQPIAEAHLFSPKVPKFKPNPAVNTAPGRITRRGIKHDGNAAGSFSEVGKKQTRQSAHRKQPLDDAQMASPKVAEVRSEISKEVTSQILGGLSASESVRLPTKTVDENRGSMSGTAIDMERASVVSGENASGEIMEDAAACIDKLTRVASATPCLPEILQSGKQQNPSDLLSSDNETPFGENFSHIKMTPVSMADVAETVPDAISDASNVQNQNAEVYVESGIFSEAVNVETSVLKSGTPDAREQMDMTESGSTSKGMQSDLMIEEPLVSVGKSVGVEEGVDKHGVADDGEQYDEDESASAQKPSMSEPDSVDGGVADGVDAQKNPFSGNDIYGECDNVISDRKSLLDMFGTPLIGKGDVRDDGVNVPKELETGSELSYNNKRLEIPVSGTDFDIERDLEDDNNAHDRESEQDQLARNDNHATDKEDVGSDDLEPVQNKSMIVAAEVLVRSCDQEPEQLLNVAVGDVPCDTVGQPGSVMSQDEPETHATSGIDDMVVRVDAPEELVVDINKDIVSSVLGDTNDMDAGGDGVNEQKLTEFDEGFQPNERGSFIDISNDPTNDEVETTRGSAHTLDDQEQAAATDHDSDSGKFMAGGSHIGLNEMTSELVGDIKAHEDLTKEEASPILYTKETTVEDIDSSQLMGDTNAHGSLITKESLQITNKDDSPVDDIGSDLPIIKEDDRNKQEETQNTFVDWGGYDFGMDEFEYPVSANRSAEMDGKGKKDDQDSDLQTSARVSSSIEESSGLESGLANSVRKLETDSRNGSDGKSNQEVDTLKESANAADMTEVFNWSGADSSLKSLFATPAATRIRHVRDNEDVVKLANQGVESSLKSLFATPADTGISRVGNSQENAVKLDNQGADSSLKSLFATPATTRIGRVRDSQEDAVKLANQDSSLKSISKTPGVPQVSHVNDGQDVKTSQEDAADFANHDHYSSLRSLFKTPAVTQSCHVKDGQEGAFSYPTNQDPYSSWKPIFTPVTTQSSHLKDALEEATSFANTDHCLSLRSLFTAPATSRTSHVNDHKTDAASFTFPEDGCNKDIGSSRTAAHEFNHQWENDPSKVFDGETQGNAVQGLENEIGVQSFEDFSFKLFKDEEGDKSGDSSGSATRNGSTPMGPKVD